MQNIQEIKMSNAKNSRLGLLQNVFCNLAVKLRGASTGSGLFYKALRIDLVVIFHEEIVLDMHRHDSKMLFIMEPCFFVQVAC